MERFDAGSCEQSVLFWADDDEIHLAIKRSFDEGATWQPLQVLCRDGGRTWSAVGDDERLPEPSCQGSILRLCGLRPGMRGPVVMAHPAARDRRAQLTLLLSRDECATWPVQRVLCNDYSGYSDLAQIASGAILCLYETDQCRALTLARTGLGWLTGTRGR